jgi:NADPH2:quinone reductase
VDLALDPVGGPMTQRVILATRRGGKVILVGGSSREPTMIDATTLVLRNHTMSGSMLSEFFHEARVRSYIDDILSGCPNSAGIAPVV